MSLTHYPCAEQWRSSLAHPVDDAVGLNVARPHLVASYRFGAALRCAFLWLPVAGVTLYITTSTDSLPDLDDACRKHLCAPYLGVLVTAIGWCFELCWCQVLLRLAAEQFTRDGLGHGVQAPPHHAILRDTFGFRDTLLLDLLLDRAEW